MNVSANQSFRQYHLHRTFKCLVLTVDAPGFSCCRSLDQNFLIKLCNYRKMNMVWKSHIKPILCPIIFHLPCAHIFQHYATLTSFTLNIKCRRNVQNYEWSIAEAFESWICAKGIFWLGTMLPSKIAYFIDAIPLNV